MDAIGILRRIQSQNLNPSSAISTIVSTNDPIQKPSEVLIKDIADRTRQLLIYCNEIQEEEVKRFAQIQLDRFDIWAFNIGVFASVQASLDRRLRAAPAAKAAVEAGLETLCYHLLTGKAYVKE